jgi:hypothetical protein
MNCFVCNASTKGAVNEHHIVPQSRGGKEGPTVMLCPTCHTLLHNVARCLIKGNDASHLYSHLPTLGSNRLLGLAQVILIAELEGNANPNPLIMVSLDSPLYLKALKLYQTDNGFSSQEKTINAMLRAIAIKYNLLQNDQPSEKRGKIRISRMKSTT